MAESPKLARASAALMLNAKYHTDPAQREFAALEAASECLGCGDTAALMSMITDPEFHLSGKAMEAAKRALPGAALRRAKISGDDGCIFEVLSHEGIPAPAKRELGMSALVKFEQSRDSAALMRLSAEKGCPFDAREAAALAFLRLAEPGPGFSLIFELTVNPDAPYSVRKQAGFRLIDLAVQHGNYPILLRLDHTNCPTDVYLELEGKADIAASKAVQDGVSSRDSYLLKSIAGEIRLGAPVRERAGGAIAALSGKDRLEPAAGGDLARELMGRLVRTAGLPLKSEPPQSTPPTGKAGVIKKSSP
jgi:hypothetical protein